MPFILFSLLAAGLAAGAPQLIPSSQGTRARIEDHLRGRRSMWHEPTIRVELGLENVTCGFRRRVGSRTLRGEFYSSFDVPGGRRSDAAEYALPFRLTDVCGFGEDRFLLAGIDSEGRTIIELWRLEDVPAPVVTDEQRRRGTLPSFSVSVESKVRLFEDALPATGGITFMAKVPGARGDALIQTFADKSLYRLRLHPDGSTSSLLATRAAKDEAAKRNGENTSPAPLVIPALGREDWTYFSAGHHLATGNVFWWHGDPHSGPRTILMVTDRDRDGTLDEWKLLEPEDWEPYAEAASFGQVTR